MPLTIMLFVYGIVALTLGAASIFIRVSVVQPASDSLRDNPGRQGGCRTVAYGHTYFRWFLRVIGAVWLVLRLVGALLEYLWSVLRGRNFLFAGVEAATGTSAELNLSLG